jgi:hypothetical protein
MSTTKYQNGVSHPDENPSETDAFTLSSSQDNYPEQRHAGAVGYGPDYKKGVVSTNMIL